MNSRACRSVSNLNRRARNNGAPTSWNGVSIIVFALSTNFVLSLLALFMTGATDGISVVIRTIITRVASPEHLRARIASVEYLFIGASNEIGAFESGVAAKLLGAATSVVVGGVLTRAIVASELVQVAFSTMAFVPSL